MKHSRDKYKYKYKYKQIFTLVLASLFIAGCGGGGSSSSVAEDPVDTNQTPVAAAGTDMVVSRNFTVNLDGSASSDDDGDALTYTWTQTSGPDVTNGAGSLSGVAPAFQAPGDVDTLMFALVVNDGQKDSTADTVIVNVLEDVNVAYFVDGDNGDDLTGNGSVDTPFASIAMALCEVTQDQQDIYVMTRANNEVYDETSESTDPCPGDPARSADKILMIPTGTSLYGGYDANWVRNKETNQSLVNILYHGFHFAPVHLNAWFSGFDVLTEDSPGPENSVYVVRAAGGDATLHINNNQLTAGNVGFGAAANPGNSYGLLVALINAAEIQHNVIAAGFGGDGLDVGNTFNTAAARGEDGFNAGGRSAGAGGDGRGIEDYDGGSGGGGGGVAAFGIGGYGSDGADGQGTLGGAGGARGSCLGCGGGNGGTGGDGSDAAIGLGGSGSGTMDVFEDGGFFASFLLGNGVKGDTGEAGHGGGGGGGGRGNLIYSGGGGGGGAGGGAGGTGGDGSPGGGISIGLFIAAVNSSVISENDISSGSGGNGATGGQGQIGGDGGAIGDGAEASAGNGGNGGIGGTGGDGGRGGAGGGGPSYGIAIGSDIAPIISNNVISSGDGGAGGFGGDGGNGGDGGDSYAVFDNDINDGIVPALSNNTSSFGLPGNGGETTGDGGSIGDVGLAGTRNW